MNVPESIRPVVLVKVRNYFAHQAETEPATLIRRPLGLL